MANNKDNKTKIETVRWIWLDFWIDENLIKSKKKKTVLDLTDNELWNENFIEKADILKFNKSFKVGNYSNKNSSGVIGKMQIEIEWIPIQDEKSFWKELHHYFK